MKRPALTLPVPILTVSSEAFILPLALTVCFIYASLEGVLLLSTIRR